MPRTFRVLYLIVGGVWQGLSRTLLKFFTDLLSQ